jgi:tetratricopeptide (TPR) repeat protein
MSGFFVGFLFGIPKRNIVKEADYSLSTNLVDISDWLTKIIIGLGLIEMKKIPVALQSIGEYIQKETNGDRSIIVFSVCSIVYFTVFGLYYGYNYMRLFLSSQFKSADDALLKISEKKEELDRKSFTPNLIDVSSTETIKEYNKLVKSTKKESDYTFDDWYYKGLEAYESKEYFKTIVYMNKAIGKDLKEKNSPNAFLFLGLAYENVKLFDKSIEQYDFILNNYPLYDKMYLVHSNKGASLYELKKFEEALREYEKAFALKPDHINSFNLKGATLICLERFDEAIVALDQVINIAPNFHKAWFNRACAYAKKKDKENMLSSLKKAVELDIENKAYATTDKDFAEYWNDDDFKNIVN